MTDAEIKQLQELVALLGDDIRLQSAADGYDDDYEADALPATLIAKCAAVRERLLKLLPSAHPALAALLAAYEAQAKQLAAAEAQVARMRDALERISKLNTELGVERGTGGYSRAHDAAWSAEIIANEALEELWP